MLSFSDENRTMPIRMILEVNEEERGSIDFMRLEKILDRSVVHLHIADSMEEQCLIKAGDRFSIKKLASEIFLVSTTSLSDVKLCDGYLVVETDRVQSARYVKYYSDIFSVWNNLDCVIDWRIFSSKKKEVWLDVCRGVNGIPVNKVVSDVVVEGAWIEDFPGLYCCLGEAFFGPGGYIGANLDSLDDCLVGIEHANACVTFKNFDELARTLNTSDARKKYGADYMDIVSEILEKHRFVIKRT